MGEKTEITSKTVGFSFNVTIEKETRVETGAKYPDKQVVKMSLGGYAETHELARLGLEVAATKIKEQIAKLEG